MELNKGPQEDIEIDLIPNSTITSIIFNNRIEGEASDEKMFCRAYAPVVMDKNRIRPDNNLDRQTETGPRLLIRPKSPAKI